MARPAADRAERLYWDGEKVVTTLLLLLYVSVAIIARALAAVVAAVWPIVQFYLYRSSFRLSAPTTISLRRSLSTRPAWSR
jgi:hypothetical protein